MNAGRLGMGLAVLALLLAGCGAGPAKPTASQMDKAAAEATAIIERAQVTAVVLRAQMTAAALVQGSTQGVALAPNTAAAAPTPAAVPAAPVISQAAPPAAATQVVAAAATPTLPASSALPAVQPPSAPAQVQAGRAMTVTPTLINVSIGGDGKLVVVNFLSNYSFADSLTVHGRAWVRDEATNDVYDNVPVMPIIGPMVGRPGKTSLQAYIMFYNHIENLKGLQKGDVVTVQLGDYKFEHVTIN